VRAADGGDRRWAGPRAQAEEFVGGEYSDMLTVRQFNWLAWEA
jgi:hypothetical protein